MDTVPPQSRSCLQMSALGKGKLSFFSGAKLDVSAILYGKPGPQESMDNNLYYAFLLRVFFLLRERTNMTLGGLGK